MRQRYKTPHPSASTFVTEGNSELHILSTRAIYKLRAAIQSVSGFWKRYTMFKCIKPEPGVMLAPVPRMVLVLDLDGQALLSTIELLNNEKSRRLDRPARAGTDYAGRQPWRR